MRKAALILLALLTCMSVRAQFNLSGNDPAKVRWMSVQSDNFRVIYPVGHDSLALEYLKSLEKYRPMVAPSVGMVQGQFQNRPMDVVLHTRNAVSNGMVAWTPSRMEMLTIPQWDNASALPWMTQLTLHEGRHAAQMQMGYRHIFRPFRYITGQIIAGAVNAYPGSLLDEGDAVVAETALSSAGRGRDSRFLSRYMYSLDNGDTRNYAKWRFGSYYRPTPNNYAYGYLLISALRTGFDSPYFMAEYFDYISRRPYDPWPLRHNMRRTTGFKFRKNLDTLMAVHYNAWAADTLARGPFMPSRQISKPVRRMVEYRNPNADGNGTQYWIKEDIYKLPALVTLDTSGREKRITAMPHYMGSLNGDDNSFVWTEVRRNPRWSQVYKTVIRQFDVRSGKKSTIAGDGTYVAPFPVNDTLLAAIRNQSEGSQALVLLHRSSGKEMGRVAAPVGLQLYAVDYLEGAFYTSAVCEKGMGIWRVHRDGWEEILPPIPVHIESLDAENGELTFESDHNGSWELYSYNMHEKQLYRVSSTKYGGVDFNRLHNGDLAFSQMQGHGIAVKYTKASELMPQKVDWNDYYHYAIADELSRQEDTLHFEQRLRHPVDVDLSVQTEFSQPERYRKAAHAFRFHSWAPLYVDVDAVEEMSGGNVQNIASLGASAWFQNSLGNFYGGIGYKAAPDGNGRWFHSGHLKLTYSGLYPVFEFQAHLNDRYSYNYFLSNDPVTKGQKLAYQESGKTLIYMYLKSYIPLQWSRGTYSYGVVPQLSLSWRNDNYLGNTAFLMSASARAYILSSVASAAVYPRYGIGAEVGWVSPYVYAYLYGYLPGIAAGQGLRLSATAQVESGLSMHPIFVAGYSNVLPRGFADMSIPGFTREGVKFTADYAIPFFMGDWHIGSAFHCKRGIVTPHFDLSIFRVINANGVNNANNITRMPGLSVGSSFEMEFGSFFWIKVPVRAGFTMSYNDSPVIPAGASRIYAGAIFNIEIPN